MGFRNKKSRKKFFADLKPDKTTLGIKLSTSPIPNAEVDVGLTWEKRARTDATWIKRARPYRTRK